MDGDRRQNRRAYLKALGVAGLVGLAGCSSEGSGGTTTENGTTATETTATPTAGTTTGNGTAGNESAGNESAGEEGSDTPQPSGDAPGSYEPMIPKAAGFEDVSAWEPDNNVTMKADTETVYGGEQSFRVQGGPGTIRRDFPVPLDLSNRDLSIAIRLEEPRPTNVRIWMQDTGGKTIKLIQQISQNHPSGWLRINPSINDAYQRNLGGIESMLITVDGRGSTAPTYNVDELLFHDKMAKKGQVMLTFDDITPSLYNEIFPIMQEFDLQGVAAVPVDLLGDSGRLSEAQLQELSDAGWEIASHSNDLQNLYGMDRATQRKKIEYTKQQLQEMGFGDVRAFMYPGGACDRNTFELVTEYHDYGFLAFRGSEKGLSQSTLFEPAFVNRSRPNTPAAVKNQLDEVAAYRGLYTPFLHGVDGGDQFVNTPSEFRKMCKHVANYRDQGKVEVVKPGDLSLPTSN
ncbi:polysaccharide deacetylase family protein [Halobium salinum]|uniref:Polysaccharide deacetylase family protein n=1 Tax=Halobium salinum TaxID=1364940 RepID=A0ABD5P9Y3_9EURY|nr:polysaccharide deacetylase family protein [Halobium salinum]